MIFIKAVIPCLGYAGHLAIASIQDLLCIDHNYCGLLDWLQMQEDGVGAFIDQFYISQTNICILFQCI